MTPRMLENTMQNIAMCCVMLGCAQSHENILAEANVDAGAVETKGSTQVSPNPVECEASKLRMRVSESVSQANAPYRVLSAEPTADGLLFTLSYTIIDPPPFTIEIAPIPPATAAQIASKWSRHSDSGRDVLLAIDEGDDNWRVRFSLPYTERPQTLFEAGRIQVNQFEDEYSSILRFDEADIDVGATNFADDCTSGERVHRYVHVDPLARGRDDVPSQGGDSNRVTVEVGATIEVTSAYQHRFSVTPVEARSHLGSTGEEIAIGALIW